ncbi:hypothetical protein Drorol1_Dr00027033 [Drosera rotundifolia]
MFHRFWKSPCVGSVPISPPVKGVASSMVDSDFMVTVLKSVMVETEAGVDLVLVRPVLKLGLLVGVRIVLKSVVALAWTIVFSVFYARIWSQKDHDLRWSDEEPGYGGEH